MRKLLYTVGLGAAWFASTASAQFATDRPNPASPPPMNPTPPAPGSLPSSGTLPSFPMPGNSSPAAQPAIQQVGATAPLTQQAPVAAATAAPRAPSHPWATKPELGGWMVCIKSYSGEGARQKAEELATILRNQYRAAAYLFEYGAEDRQQELERRRMIQDKLAREQAPFLKIQQELKEQAAKEGRIFVDTPLKLRYGKIEYPEQWAVLVGGFKDMDTARKALDTIRTWPVPQAEHLLDRAVISRPGDGNAPGQTEGAFLNPFASSMVVPNPALRRSGDQPPPVDPALVKLNEEEPLSLLKARGKFTLMVKGFTLQTVTKQRDEDRSVMDRLLNRGGPDAAEQLEATAKQARVLAQSLRTPEMSKSINLAAPRLGLTPRPIDSFVLHIRNGSIVTVGQYDSPEDPALLEMQRLLQGTEFRIEYKDGRPPETKRLFDNVYPMAIPRVH